MDASRFWTSAYETGLEPVMKCNLLPGESFEQVERWLIQSVSGRPKAAILTHLAERLPERFAAALLQHAGIDPATVGGHLAPRQEDRSSTRSPL